MKFRELEIFFIKFIPLLLMFLLFLNCPTQKEKNKKEGREAFWQSYLLSNLLIQTRTAQNTTIYCDSTNVTTASTTQQTLAFGKPDPAQTKPTNYTKATLKSGQKLTFTSTTTNIKFLIPISGMRIGDYCTDKKAQSAEDTGICTRTTTGTTQLQYTCNTNNLYTIDIDSSETSAPTDIKVIIE